MKYRLKTPHGVRDFDEEPEARKEFSSAKKKLSKGDSASIHKCYHEEGLSCKGHGIDSFLKE